MHTNYITGLNGKFKIDDAVGAVAVHGYAGFVGLVICGFVLNGYPSSGYSVGAMWTDQLTQQSIHWDNSWEQS